MFGKKKSYRKIVQNFFYASTTLHFNVGFLLNYFKLKLKLFFCSMKQILPLSKNLDFPRSLRKQNFPLFQLIFYFHYHSPISCQKYNLQHIIGFVKKSSISLVRKSRAHTHSTSLYVRFEKFSVLHRNFERTIYSFTLNYQSPK